MASTPAAVVGHSSASSEPDTAPQFAVDASASAVVIAEKCMRELERLEDELKVRDLRAVA